MVAYLTEYNLLDLIWGFEVLNEPVTNSQSDLDHLRTYTEGVANTVLAPVLSSNANQVLVLQPGPGNDKISAYENYNSASKTSKLFLISTSTFVLEIHCI